MSLNSPKENNGSSDGTNTNQNTSIVQYYGFYSGNCGYCKSTNSGSRKNHGKYVEIKKTKINRLQY